MEEEQTKVVNKKQRKSKDVSGNSSKDGGNNHQKKRKEPSSKNVDHKKKPKAKKSKKALVAKPVMPKPVTYSSKDSSKRTYGDELEDYLDGWENRANGSWKFNKVIQSWALENCFHKDKIDTDVFKKLIPYILTVQGGARERLLTVATDMITKCESGEALLEDNEDEETSPEVEDGKEGESVEKPSNKVRVSKKMLKRAMKIKSVLTEQS